MNELTPLCAATALDPYPYYARLVDERPFYRDEQLGMWIASSARAVEAVLLGEVMRVRPSAEPVPAQIAGTPSGDLFGRFMRMTDGTYHARLKQASLRALDAFASSGLEQWAAECIGAFPERTLEGLMFRFPAFAMARALGLTRERALRAADAARSFAAAFSSEGTQTLLAQVRSARGPLYCAFREAAADVDPQAVAANAASFLFQSCDATAGLIGNTLRALARDRHHDLDELVAYVARYDSPVQNTRRFAAADAALLDTTVPAGETVLVLIAAANRDPRSQRSYTFGFGKHACPGERIACALAAAAVSAVLRRIDPRALRFIRYRPSPNARIPEFAQT